MKPPRRHQTPISDASRSGAAAVEFAFIFPLYLTLVLGTVELGRALDVSITMHAAVREAGRLASMDIHKYVAPGEDPNDKIINDVKNFLAASGLPAGAVTVTVVDPTMPGEPTFDLDLPANQLKLFRVKATIPYNSVSTFPLTYMGGKNVESSLVFRLGKSQLSN